MNAGNCWGKNTIGPQRPVCWKSPGKRLYPIACLCRHRRESGRYNFKIFATNTRKRSPRSGRFTRVKNPVPVVMEAGWISASVWMDTEIFASTRIRSRNDALYGLRFSGSHKIVHALKKTSGRVLGFCGFIVLIFYCVDILLCWFFIVLIFYCADILLCWYFIVLIFYCADILLYWYFIVLIFYCADILL
jgi:preprotein translocase subunit SecE